MKQETLEKSAIAFCGAVLVGWTIYWFIQVLDVIELLKLAYGD